MLYSLISSVYNIGKFVVIGATKLLVTGFLLNYAHKSLRSTIPAYASLSDYIRAETNRVVFGTSSTATNIHLPSIPTPANTDTPKFLALISLILYISMKENENDEIQRQRKNCAELALRELQAAYPAIIIEPSQLRVLLTLNATNYLVQHFYSLFQRTTYNYQLTIYNYELNCREAMYRLLSLPELAPLLPYYTTFLATINSNDEDFWIIFARFHQRFKEIGPILGNHFFKKIMIEAEEQIDALQTTITTSISPALPQMIADNVSFLTKTKLRFFKSNLIKAVANTASDMDNELISTGKLSSEKVNEIGGKLVLEALPTITSAYNAIFEECSNQISNNTHLGSAIRSSFQ